MGKYSTPVTYQGARKPAQPYKKEYAPLDWSRVDVTAMIERHTSTSLKKEGNTQLVGACPYHDCSGDDDGFIVWPGKSKYGQHFLCRTCGRTGDLIKLLEDINGWDFKQCVVEIGLKDQGDMSTRGYARMEEPPETAQDIWARDQLAQLGYYYPAMLQAIAMERPRHYLQERGFTLAAARLYGIGYFPLLEEMKEEKRDALQNNAYLRPWLGRIVFPLTGVGKGMTFAGRTLRLWVPGMSPAQHKAAIEAYNAAETDTGKQIIRTRKTRPCGYFGYEEAVKRSHLIIVEGEFDALSLLIAGLTGIVAMGTSMPANLIPLRVETVTLALDTDKPGADAAKRLSNALCNKGLDVSIVLPANGKDWNDTHVQAGLDAIREAFNPPDKAPPVEECQPETLLCEACGIDGTLVPDTFLYDEQGLFAYCPACWAKREKALSDDPFPARHPLVDDRMPDIFRTNHCPRCGRYGEAAINPSTGAWGCICHQLETFEQAKAGKAARLAAQQKG